MQKVFGGLMLGCGILVAGLSGLCTLLVAGTSLIDASGPQELMSVLPASLIFGGIPVAIGIGLFFGGRALVRSAKAEEEREPPTF